MVETDYMRKLISLNQDNMPKEDDFLLLVEDFIGRVCDFCFDRFDEDSIEIINMALCVLRGLKSEYINMVDTNNTRMDTLNELMKCRIDEKRSDINKMNEIAYEIEIVRKELNRLRLEFVYENVTE